MEESTTIESDNIVHGKSVVSWRLVGKKEGRTTSISFYETCEFKSLFVKQALFPINMSKSKCNIETFFTNSNTYTAEG